MERFYNTNPSEENIISQTYTTFSSTFEPDTLRIYLHNSYIEDNYDFNLLYELIKAEQKGNRIVGRYRNFKISIDSSQGITLTGSFSNYYVGKTKILPFNKLKDAVSKLSDELGLSLHEARLYRVDVNWNTITDKDVSTYTHHLFIDLPRFKRLEQDKGVTFKTQSKALIFYNKSKELFEKQNKIVKNWFRIEFKLLKNVKKNSGLSKLKELYSFSKFKILVDMLYNYYYKVKKKVVPKNFYDLKNVKDFLNYLIVKGIENSGGIEAIYKEIEQLDSENKFTSRKQKYRLRLKMKTISENNELTTLHPLVVELNQKINFSYKNTKTWI